MFSNYNHLSFILVATLRLFRATPDTIFECVAPGSWSTLSVLYRETGSFLYFVTNVARPVPYSLFKVTAYTFFLSCKFPPVKMNWLVNVFIFQNNNVLTDIFLIFFVVLLVRGVRGTQRYVQTGVKYLWFFMIIGFKVFKFSYRYSLD